MRAVVQERYGSTDVFEVREIDMPAVRDDEVLVRVRAASVHLDVWHAVSGRPYVLRLMGAGLRRPKNRIPGTDMAGHVESVGDKVTRFRPGDEVFGETVRGYQWHNGGAFAEFVSVPHDVLARKPSNITFEQAAAVPTSGLVALHNLPSEGQLGPGHHVLVNGAGGGVGTFAVQLAKAYGATVTGVDNATKLDMVRSLGADRVIDYTKEDFTLSGERYDVILDVPGESSVQGMSDALFTPMGCTCSSGVRVRRPVVWEPAARSRTARDVTVRASAAGSELLDAHQETDGCPDGGSLKPENSHRSLTEPTH